MKTITTNDLRDILAGVNHAMPISFSAFTKVKARVNPFGEIRKLSRVSAFIGGSYESAVNKQRAREGFENQFEAKPRQWGEHVNNALIRKGDSYYLGARILRASSPVFFCPRGGMMVRIGKHQIAPFLPVHRASQLQGTDKEIVYREYSLENLTFLAMQGEQYRIRGAA